MASLGELKQKYDEMDPVQRQNFWYIVVGVILLILLITSLSDTMSTIGSIFKSTTKYVNTTVGSASNLAKKP